MLGTIDAHRFGNPGVVPAPGVLPARRQFLERQLVGRVAIYLVRGQKDEYGVRAHPAGGFKQVEGPHGVDVEVVEGTRCREIVAWLRGAMHDQIKRRLPFVEVLQAVPIPYIQIPMPEVAGGGPKAPEVPFGVPFASEEIGAHVVIDPEHAVRSGIEECHDLGPDQAARTGHQDFHGMALFFTALPVSALSLSWRCRASPWG